MPIKKLAAASVFMASVLMPLGAHAQQVDPFKPFASSPPGTRTAPLVNPPNSTVQGNTTGVIVPPPQISKMPVIKPTVPSRMPVIAPPGSSGGNPNVVPK